MNQIVPAMYRTLALLLIIVGMGLLIYGGYLYTNSSASVEILGLELSASDNQAKSQALVFVGSGLVAIIVGALFYRKK